jgi:histidinol-phosphate phosphatase family protein
VKPAVFLDRDGTVIEHVHHLHRCEDVALIPGAASAIVKLREAGYACVLVTNQSVVGRGMLDIPGLDAIHAKMSEQLRAGGAVLDGIYYSTVVPKGRDQTVVEHPDRKPGPGMLLRAAEELQLSLADSWMIGDSLSDLLAGENAGCRESLLVSTGYGAGTRAEHGNGYRAFPSIGEAAAAIVAETRS